MKGFKVIVVTPERPVADEVKLCCQMLDGGIDFIHLRHPDLDDDGMEAIVREFPVRYRSRVRLHSAFRLCAKYGLAGAHLNRRHPSAPDGCALTKSCHSTEELADANRYDYVTLSPVYDSISKPGYLKGIDFEALRNKLAGKCVIALGGVTPEKFKELADAGFAGAMMLGYFWETPTEEAIEKKLKETERECCSL